MRYHGTRHPRTLGAKHVSRFLEHLTTEREVAASTQNQALSALVFLYEEVLKLEIGSFEGFARAKRTKRLPVVLTRTEVGELLAVMLGEARLAAGLL